MLAWKRCSTLLTTALTVILPIGATAQNAAAETYTSAHRSVRHAQRMMSACAGAVERAAPLITARMGLPVALSTASLDVLAAELKLTAEQKKKVDSAQEKLDVEVRGLMYSGDTDRTMQVTRMSEAVAQADKDVGSVLTSEQKPLVPPLLKNLTTLRSTGLPPELYCDLKLTDAQLKKLTALVPEVKQENKERMAALKRLGSRGDPDQIQKLAFALSDKVLAVLTKDQKPLVEKYRKSHPLMIIP